ncbi:hypothetical protein A2U01_0061184, partial [Trifolium medium]|nr:hypothetical protein [Trifolium medium]
EDEEEEAKQEILSEEKAEVVEEVAEQEIVAENLAGE